MAEVSVQLHSCLNTMKTLSREKRDHILKSQQEIFELKKNYQALGVTISEKEEALASDTSELEALNVHIKETQQQYKKILDSTHELMRQVKEYNPTKVEKAENIIEETLDDLKKSHQEIQMTNYTIAKNKHDSESKLSATSLTSMQEPEATIEADSSVNVLSESKAKDGKSSESGKKKGVFSHKLKTMQKDMRNNKKTKTDEEVTPLVNNEEVSLMIEE